MEEIKSRIAEYWTQRVEGFSQLRRKELEDKRADLWLAELERYLPSGNLKILDIGTGTGFFAFLLERRGHEVVGIDLTDEMIEEAKRQAQSLGSHVMFHVMDAESPEFPLGSFDAIVTRNLTWTLPNLVNAYSAWYSLLKVDGVLINIDGDYCHEKPVGELPENHVHKDLGAALIHEYESIKEILKGKQSLRPDWDCEILERIGFRDIHVDEGVWQRINPEVDEFYNPTPTFTISARV